MVTSLHVYNAFTFCTNRGRKRRKSVHYMYVMSLCGALIARGRSDHQMLLNDAYCGSLERTRQRFLWDHNNPIKTSIVDCHIVKVTLHPIGTDSSLLKQENAEGACSFTWLITHIHCIRSIRKSVSINSYEKKLFSTFNCKERVSFSIMLGPGPHHLLSYEK